MFHHLLQSRSGTRCPHCCTAAEKISYAGNQHETLVLQGIVHHGPENVTPETQNQTHGSSIELKRYHDEDNECL